MSTRKLAETADGKYWLESCEFIGDAGERRIAYKVVTHNYENSGYAGAFVEFPVKMPNTMCYFAGDALLFPDDDYASDEVVQSMFPTLVDTIKDTMQKKAVTIEVK